MVKITDIETIPIEPEGVLHFWREAGPSRWYTKDAVFDEEVRERFAVAHEAAARGALTAWQDTPEHALALVIVLDQFPRNIFRNDLRAYATDGAARAVARRAINRGFDKKVPAIDRRFFYLPFMHSEAPDDQERCIALCREADDDEGVRYAELHADIIRRFGRFPHRNAVLGRRTTPDEQAFLDGGGFAG
jgi:uncharacterized protein (DUF924 family)